jgi:putative FmdB family regulatory protein
MPVYDYDCAACGRRFEVVHGVHVDGPATCPLCGKGPVRKAISAPAVHYKGSGWAKKERRASVTSGASKATADAATTSGDSSKSDSESKTESESKTDVRPSSEGKASGSDSPATPKAATADASKPTR